MTLPPLPVAHPAERPLTTREHEVMRLATRGYSDRAIGRQLGICPKTVRNHLCQVFAKMGIAAAEGISSRTLAVQVYRRMVEGR